MSTSVQPWACRPASASSTLGTETPPRASFARTGSLTQASTAAAPRPGCARRQASSTARAKGSRSRSRAAADVVP